MVVAVLELATNGSPQLIHGQIMPILIKHVVSYGPLKRNMATP
jgi:hypothetical protein